MKKALLLTILVAITWIATACQSNPPDQTRVVPSQTALTSTEASGDVPIQTVEPPVSSDFDGSPSPPMPTEIVQTTLPVEPPPSESPTPPPVQPGPSVDPTRPPAAADCLNQGAFVADVNTPDGAILRPGTKFTKIWRVANTGTCDWDESYALVFFGGDIMNGPLTQSMPSIRAGEMGDISIDLTAPVRGGEQAGFYMFQNPAGERFGLGVPSVDTIWVKINVTFTDASGVPVAVAPIVGSSPVPEGGLEAPPAQPVGVNVDSGATEDTDPESGESLFPNCSYKENRAFVDEILRLVNQARQQNGLDLVFIQDQLSAAALKHSADMACNRFVDHNGSDGSTWYQRVQAQGYSSPNTARENIYVGDPGFGGNAAGAFNWWMNSQVHRDNILNSTVSEVGIGYVFSAGSPQGGYFTLVLARR